MQFVYICVYTDVQDTESWSVFQEVSWCNNHEEIENVSVTTHHYNRLYVPAYLNYLYNYTIL